MTSSTDQQELDAFLRPDNAYRLPSYESSNLLYQPDSNNGSYTNGQIQIDGFQIKDHWSSPRLCSQYSGQSDLVKRNAIHGDHPNWFRKMVVR